MKKENVNIKIELADVLHFCKGWEVLFHETLIEGHTVLRKGVIIGFEDDVITFHPIRNNGQVDCQTRCRRRVGHFQLLARPLSDMTGDERLEAKNLARTGQLYHSCANTTSFLLSKRFDLFNLIKTGQAIDATTTKDKRSVATAAK